jgi:hypothetical protein
VTPFEKWWRSLPEWSSLKARDREFPSTLGAVMGVWDAAFEAGRDAGVAAERERCQAIVRPYHNGASSAPEVYDAGGDIAREIESGLPSRWYRDDAGNWNYRNHGGPTDAEQGEDQAVTGPTAEVPHGPAET